MAIMRTTGSTPPIIEVPGEVARAHPGLVREVAHRQRLLKALQRPFHQAGEYVVPAVRDRGRVISVIPPFGPLQLERGITGESFAAHGGRERLAALSRLVDAGALRPQVEAVLPLDQARDALTRVAGRHTRGKIVLQMGPPPRDGS